MPADSVATVWETLRRHDGVPYWWAETMVNIGFTAAEAETWVQTAEQDPGSPLARIREKELNVTLQGYARARGIRLLGAGDGDDVESSKIDKLVHKVSTIMTPQEQDAVLAEVGMFADVEFREKVNGVYSQHAVANAVRAVHAGYLNRIVGDSMVLEAGASVKSAVMAGVDPTKRHCCSPVLDVRDSVRHSLKGWLTSVMRNESKYSERIRAAAKAALDPESGFVCRNKTQDCTKQVEVICSNESTHDIPFDDLPQIMARHGARLWVGFMTRAPGVRAVGGPTSGRCQVLGTRWRLDRESDRITFHFDRDGSFSYTHQFSQWVKYEEQFGFRWRGQFHDYVYSRLPITTTASLAFVVARVPKTVNFVKEPVYKASGLEGMVKITSVKAVGSCLSKVKPRFEPVTFVMEAVVFDRVLETRLAQGERGNLASTIAYMRSARVRLAVNGVALGAVTNVPVDLLEPAAVAVEVLAADNRRSGERDYSTIMRVAASGGASLRIASYFAGLARTAAGVRSGIVDAIRVALAEVLNGKQPIVVKAEKCAPYVKVNDGDGIGVVSCKEELSVSGCGCSDLAAINGALAMGNALSRQERRELLDYQERLRALADKCVEHNAHLVEADEAEDAFLDAQEEWDADQESRPSSSSASSESRRSDSSTAVSSGTSCTSVASEACESLCVDGSVSSVSEEDESATVTAIREYARWAQAADHFARTEAELDCDVLFMHGPPTEGDVERSQTARTRHAVISVVNGKLKKVIGTLREDEKPAELYVRSLRRTCKIFEGKGSERYIREPVTELCYTSNRLMVMNGDELCRAALRVLQEIPRGFSFPKYPFVVGVPGAGKTYEAKQEMRNAIGAGKSVMYLTATSASCKDVTAFVTREFGEAAAVCRTYDSYLINGATPVGGGSVDLLLMDEAPMAHKGELFACMQKASALNVRLYGDGCQIPWLPFMAGFEARYQEIGDEFTKEYRYKTHRFGAATCAMWLDVYGKIYPCDCCEHEDILPRVERVTSAVGVPKCDTGKTLVFTQEERVTMKREGGFEASVTQLKSMDSGGLSTVAEDQGGTHDDVHVVRLVNKKNPKESRLSPSIYNRQPWVLVATTRHRKRLVYYTTADDDLVQARIELARCPVRLEAVMGHKDWDSVKYRAMSVREFGV